MISIIHLRVYGNSVILKTFKEYIRDYKEITKTRSKIAKIVENAIKWEVISVESLKANYLDIVEYLRIARNAEARFTLKNFKAPTI